MTNNTNVVEAEVKSKSCVGNHPDGAQPAVTHFHKGGPLVCGTHYARMRRAEKEAKKGQEKVAVEAALKEPAPTHEIKQRSKPETTNTNNNSEDMVEIWIETAAKIRGVSVDTLKHEILREYYNQTCPEYLRRDVAEKKETH